MIKQFRKKPVVIEAIQFLGDLNLQECLDFVGGNCGGDDTRIVIETLEGDMTCQRFDWVIKGVNGEKYPCKPDIFEKTYEPL
jgi:hypothetical protein